MPSNHVYKLHINTNLGHTFCGRDLSISPTISTQLVSQTEQEKLCGQCLLKYKKLKEKGPKVIRKAKYDLGGKYS